MDLSLPSELGYEVVARDAVAALARRVGFEEERIEDLKTAIGEACTNAIEHGNELRADLRIGVACWYADQRLTVRVCDAGVVRFRGPPIFRSIAEKLFGGAPASNRGMGLMLIEQLADESGFVQQNDSGNCFQFVFYHAEK